MTEIPFLSPQDCYFYHGRWQKSNFFVYFFVFSYVQVKNTS